MLVIPWVLDAETMQMGVDWHLLEESKILSLKKMLKILLAISASTDQRLQVGVSNPR